MDFRTDETVAMVLGNLCLARWARFLEFLWILFINTSPRRRLGGRKTDLSLEMNGTTLESGDRCHRKHEMLMFSIMCSQRVLAFGADPVD